MSAVSKGGKWPTNFPEFTPKTLQEFLIEKCFAFESINRVGFKVIFGFFFFFALSMFFFMFFNHRRSSIL